MASLGDLMIRVGVNIDGFQDAFKSVASTLDDAQEKVAKFGESVLHMGEAFDIGVSAPIIEAGKVLIEFGETMEGVSHKFESQTGAMGQDLENLKGSFEKVFSELPASAAQVSDVMTLITQRLELTGPALETMTTNFLNFAKVVGGEVKPLTEQLLGTFAQWGVQTDQQTEKMNFLLAVVQKSGVGMSEMLEGLKKFGPAMQAVGISFDQAAAMIGNFTKAGVPAEKSLNGIGLAIKALAKANVTDVTASFKALILAIKDADTDTKAFELGVKVFGKSTVDMVAAIRTGKVDLDDFMLKVKGAGADFTKTAANVQTLGDQFTKLKNAITEALGPVGEILIRAMKDMVSAVQTLVPYLKELADGFQSLPQWIQTTIIAFLAALAAIGPLLTAFGLIGMGISGVIQGFTALAGSAGMIATLLPVIAYAATAVAVAFALWELPAVVTYLDNLGNTLLANEEKMKAFSASSQSFFQDWPGWAKTAIDTISGLETDMETAFIRANQVFVKEFNELKDAGTLAWTYIKTSADGLFKTMMDGNKSLVATNQSMHDLGVATAALANHQNDLVIAAKAQIQAQKDQAAISQIIIDLTGKHAKAIDEVKAAYDYWHAALDKANEKLAEHKGQLLLTKVTLDDLHKEIDKQSSAMWPAWDSAMTKPFKQLADAEVSAENLANAMNSKLAPAMVQVQIPTSEASKAMQYFGINSLTAFNDAHDAATKYFNDTKALYKEGIVGLYSYQVATKQYLEEEIKYYQQTGQNADDLKNQLAKVEVAMGEHVKGIHDHMDELAKAVSDAIGKSIVSLGELLVSGKLTFSSIEDALKSIGQAFITTFNKIASDAISQFIKNDIKKLLTSLSSTDDALSGLGKSFMSLFGGGGSIAGGASGGINLGFGGLDAGSGGGIGGAVSGAAGMGGMFASMGSIVGVVGVAVQALSGIVQGIQGAHMNALLDKIEKSTRFTWIVTGQQSDSIQATSKITSQNTGFVMDRWRDALDLWHNINFHIQNLHDDLAGIKAAIETNTSAVNSGGGKGGKKGTAFTPVEPPISFGDTAYQDQAENNNNLLDGVNAIEQNTYANIDYSQLTSNATSAIATATAQTATTLPLLHSAITDGLGGTGMVTKVIQSTGAAVVAAVQTVTATVKPAMQQMALVAASVALVLNPAGGTAGMTMGGIIAQGFGGLSPTAIQGGGALGGVGQIPLTDAQIQANYARLFGSGNTGTTVNLNLNNSTISSQRAADELMNSMVRNLRNAGHKI